MRNILKLGLISAVTAIALAQTPAAQGMDEDVLAIATQGALSDSMQGFRKLADDEAGSVIGGVNYIPTTERGIVDNFGNLQYYKRYYGVQLTSTESSKRKLDIGNGLNAADYMNYEFINDPQRNEYLFIEISYVSGRGTSAQVMKGNPNTGLGSTVTYLTNFTSRFANHAMGRKLSEFNDAKNRFYNSRR